MRKMLVVYHWVNNQISLCEIDRINGKTINIKCQHTKREKKNVNKEDNSG